MFHHQHVYPLHYYLYCFFGFIFFVGVIYGDLIHLFGDIIPFLDTMIDDVNVIVETILSEFGDLAHFSFVSEVLANNVKD